VKPSVPLVVKILLVAMLNIVVLVLAVALFVQYELGQEFSSFLLTPGRERIQAVARQLALDLNDTAEPDRDALLERYGQEHGVAFLLVRNDASRIAGPLMEVPAAVAAKVREARQGPEERGRRGEPPPRRGGPRPPDMELGAGLDGRGRGVPPLPRTPPFLVTTDGPDKYWVGVRIPVRARGGDDTMPGTLLLASSSLLGNPFYFQPLPWIAILLVTLGLTLACWLPLVRGVTRSIGDMTRATGEIAAGRFGVALASSRRDELGVLGTAIQSMATRLQTLLAGQKRFLRDAAHELRSPVARMSLSLGLLERDADDKTRRHVADLQEEIELMAALTDQLLAFARSEASQQVRLAPVSARDAIARAVRIEAGAADVHVEAGQDVQVLADPDLLVRALSNLVRNAVAYAGGAGPIQIRAQSEGADVCVSVADRGPGVPAADLGLLFSPFYRAEPSRDRRTGGTGLGLAIVHSAIEACRGSVSCRNLSPSGFEVTIRLPSAPSA